MSTKFYAINRATGERWKSDTRHKQYLMMYDSGYLAVVTNYGRYEGESISKLDPTVWRVVVRDTILKPDNAEES
jgi:hypothetical protein